jgi:LytR cell envelope-related transcriptional attenuator
VRVYNNSTIKGLAARAGADFTGAGWQVEVTGNYPKGTIPTSTVYFRAGTPEEAAAVVLGNRFDLRIEPRFPGIDPASPGLIVIVTNDYGGK